jgi:hypothetical protein
MLGMTCGAEEDVIHRDLLIPVREHGVPHSRMYVAGTGIATIAGFVINMYMRVDMCTCMLKVLKNK